LTTLQHDGKYFRNETWPNGVGKYKWSSTVCQNFMSKFHELWSTNADKYDWSFHPPSANSASCFIAKLRTRRSTKRCETVGIKHANKLLYKSFGSSAQKWWPKTVYLCSFFRRLGDLMTNIFLMEHAKNNWGTALEITKGSLLIRRYRKEQSENPLHTNTFVQGGPKTK